MHTHDNHRPLIGFSLIETIVYISIAALMITTVVLFIHSLIDGRSRHETIIEVEQQGSAALQRITHNIRNATAITTPATGATATALTITVPTGSLSPTTFDVSSGMLRITEGAAEPVLLTNQKVTVSNIAFSNLTRTNTRGVVRVQFTVSYTNPSGLDTYNYSKIFTASASLR